MSDDVGPLENLAEHAHETHVVVIGGGIAGLVSALECAKVGLRVTLLEAQDALGGIIRAHEMAGERVDVGADGWSAAGGHVGRLVEELGIADAISGETGSRAWVSGIPSGAAPLPTEVVLGIPANPWDPAVRRIIGWRGVWRAYVDRLRPPLTIGQEHSLGTLVRSRMGDRVVERLVAPLTHGRHGIAPVDVDVDIAAPGLNAALTRTGSLGGAVSQLRGAPRRGAAYETLAGGMTRLVDALQRRLGELGVEIRIGAEATGLEKRGSAGWSVMVDDGALVADAVVVATPQRTARQLLAAHVAALSPEPTGERVLDVVTLVVDGPALATPPRSALVYSVPGTNPAAVAFITTARWPWLAERFGPSRHVVRTMFPDGAPEGAAAAVGREAASALLGVTLAEHDVVDARLDRHDAALPPSALGQVAEAERVRAAVRAVPGLAVVGAWIAGSGLAHVVPDTVAEAERVRRHALFGADAAD